MWVNGLGSNTATPTAGGRLGTAVPDTHLFGMTKGQDGGDTSSYGGDDVNAELFEAFDRLFPDIERDYLRTITEMVNRGTGPGVGSFGPQTGDPFIQWQPDSSIGHNFQFAYRTNAITPGPSHRASRIASVAETRAAQAQLGNVLVPKRRGGAVGGLAVASGVMRQDTAICCARVSGGAAVSSRATDAAVLCFGLVLAHPRD